MVKNDVRMVPGFPHYQPHAAEVLRNRKFDMAFLLIMQAMVVVYAAYAYMHNFDPTLLASSCYTYSNDPKLTTDPISVRQLCYKSDNAETRDAFHTFQCSIAHSGETWGVKVQSESVSVTEQQTSGGGQSGSGGGGGGNNNPPPPNQGGQSGGGGTNNVGNCANPKRNVGQPCQSPCDCSTNSCNVQDGKCVSGNGRRRRRAKEEEGTYVSSIEDQNKFCSVTEQVPLDTALEAFLVQSKPYPGISVNEDSLSVVGSFRADSINSENAQVYEITEREDNKYTRITCCGYKFKTTSEKFFAWAAQVGGIAGLLHGIFLGASALDLGSMFGKPSSEEMKSKRRANDESSPEQEVELVL